jgi:hypothetical protein
MRALKDFKALISEKTEPRSIKILRRSMFILPVFLLIIVSNRLITLVIIPLVIDLVFKFSENTEFSQAIYAILESYQRYETMANINYKCRKIELLAT